MYRNTLVQKAEVGGGDNALREYEFEKYSREIQLRNTV